MSPTYTRQIVVYSSSNDKGVSLHTILVVSLARSKGSECIKLNPLMRVPTPCKNGSNESSNDALSSSNCTDHVSVHV